MFISNFAVKNPVTANLAMIIIIVIGSIVFMKLPKAMMPDVDFYWASIITQYTGASPEDIEKLVTKPIEDEIQDIEDLEIIYSSSFEGLSVLLVNFESDIKNFDMTIQELRIEVDNVEDLPALVEKPVVTKLGTDTQFPLILLILSGIENEWERKRIAEDLKDRILSINGIKEVDILGIRDREIRIEVDREKLEGYGLSLQHIADSLKFRNLIVPSSDIKIGRQEYIVRPSNEFKNLHEIEEMVVLSSQNGSQVKIKDIGSVVNAFEEKKILTKEKGEDAIAFWITKKRKKDAITTIEDLKNVVYEFRKTLPKDARIKLAFDTGHIISKTLRVLTNNIAIGIVLILLLLLLFLGWRNALLAALGIPVIFMLTFMLISWFEMTINTAVLFGLVLVLGMLVDDSIVIIENIYRHMELGHTPREAAMLGAGEVAAPVFAFTLTTIAAFLPVLIMSGPIGEFLAEVPKVVCFALVASLFEAFFILPSHMAEYGKLKVRTRKSKGLRTKPAVSSPDWFMALRKVYMKYLFKVLRYRYFAIGITIFIALISLFSIKLLGSNLFVYEELSQFSIRVRLPMGTNIEETERIISRIEKMVVGLPKGEVDLIVSNTGYIKEDYGSTLATHVGQVVVDLADKEKLKRELDEIIAELRNKIQTIPGIESFEFAKFKNAPPVGKAVEVDVRGRDFGQLKVIADLLKEDLKKMKGVYDVTDDFTKGKNELRVKVKEDIAQTLGLDTFTIVRAVRNAFSGNKATTFREGTEELDVVVKFQEKYRNDINDVKRLKILNRYGKLVQLSDVADIEISKGFFNIRRKDRKRAIRVMADIDQKITTSVQVNKELQKKFSDIERRFPGYSFNFAGEFKETEKSFRSLKEALVIALILIYFILGVQFKSFSQPLIIMFTVPFSFIGVALGLILGNNPFSLVVFLGVVGLAGIVVNDSIVLMDFINRLREKGVSRFKSITQACQVRLRPILLTSITTIFGLLPAALGIGGRSLVWEPLANSIIWGLSVATLLTIFILPALFAITDDLLNFIEKKSKGTTI